MDALKATSVLPPLAVKIETENLVKTTDSETARNHS